MLVSEDGGTTRSNIEIEKEIRTLQLFNFNFNFCIRNVGAYPLSLRVNNSNSG